MNDKDKKTNQDARRTPVLKDDKYCSPWCGCGCTKKAYDDAVEKSNQLCKQLGVNWKPRVWENCGWHYTVKLSVKNGYIEVHSRSANGNYWIDSRLPEQFEVTTSDIHKGIKQVLNKSYSESEKSINTVNELNKLL